MDSRFDLPHESSQSNAIVKNRFIPIDETKTKSTTISLDDSVPFEDSHGFQSFNLVPSENLPSTNSMNDDDTNVTFRSLQSVSSNRKNISGVLIHENNSNSSNLLHPPDKTLFYVTSPVNDDDSNSYSSCDQALLAQHEENNLFISNTNQFTSHNDLNNRITSNQMNERTDTTSKLNESFSNTSVYDFDDDNSVTINPTTIYLDRVQENPSNRLCADCNAECPTIAIKSWLLVICKKCAAIHHRLTSEFLHLQSLISTTCDWDLIDLINDYGNRYSNTLLEYSLSKDSKPNLNSSDFERKQFIRKKYIEKSFLKPFDSNRSVYTQDQLNKILYENVETADYKKTLHLILLGANPNYSEKNFAVADHAQRHQQIKQMKMILANGGLAEFNVTKTKISDVNESIVYLSSKHGVLKEFLTRYENDRLTIYSPTHSTDRPQRCLLEIDLNNVLAICNQPVTAVTLKCRLTTPQIINANSQCTMVVDEQTSLNEYVWVFQNDLERSLWIREIIKRQYYYYQLIYSDFILLMKLNIQEGINAEKQQVTGIIYSGRFVIYSDRMFDEVDLRKYSSLSYQKSKEFTGVVLCLVSNRFLYLSSPITRLMDMLYSCLRQAIKVKTLTNLNEQILTSQNIPVIVERFVNFLFEHGLLSKGIYRQAGQETKIKQLLSDCLDDPFTTSLTRENYTEHDVANALKRFLRQLEIPLLGTRKNYQAWLRSTVDDSMTKEQLIQYYRGLLKDLKQNLPIHYSTLRKILMHINNVAMLSDLNSMTISNLIATFGPCLVSQQRSMSTNFNYGMQNLRKKSVDAIDTTHLTGQNQFFQEDQLTPYSTPNLSKLRRNRSFNSTEDSVSCISQPSQGPLSIGYAHAIPSIQADLQILENIFEYYTEIFDITEEELEHEKTCIETLVAMRYNPSVPRKIDGALISVYFESRAEELNGYAMYILEKETTADTITEKLLRQVSKSDCYFWALFEVIIDENLERPMYSCENISEVFYRYRTCLSHELNRQATFVVKLNYVQFEKERLEQRQQGFNNQTVQCEYFDVSNQRWIPCIWNFERAALKIYRISNNVNDKTVKMKSSVDQQEPTLNILDQQSLIYSWSIEDIYLYVGADCRFVSPFDMNEYRVLTILPPQMNELSNNEETIFGVPFRFVDRNQMFSWYLELVHVNGHDKWIRRAPRSMPDGVNYLPLQNYHASSAASQKAKSDLFKNRFKEKSRHIVTNFCRQLRK